jgi:RTA1 like protein
MASGWGSEIMKDEVSFMILDGGMILIAVVLLTIIHPDKYSPLIGDKQMIAELTGNAIPLKKTNVRRGDL